MSDSSLTLTEFQKRVLIRPALHDDVTSVNKMGDMYGGRDYLYAMYHAFLDDPCVHALVAELDGRVIGFEMVHIVDGGKTANKRAGRMYKEFRGKGLLNVFFHHIDIYVKSLKNPTVDLYTSGTINVSDMVAASMTRKGRTEITRKRILNMNYRASDINLAVQGESGALASQVIEMKVNDLKAFLRRSDLVEAFLPGNIFFNRFMGFKPQECNIPLLINSLSKVYATTKVPFEKSNAVAAETCSLSKDRHFTDAMISGISMITCTEEFPSLEGTVFACNFYSAGDKTGVRKHIARHMARMKEVTPERGFLSLSFTNELTDDDVLPLLKQYGVRSFMPGTGTHKVWWEHPVRPESKL